MLNDFSLELLSFHTLFIQYSYRFSARTFSYTNVIPPRKISNHLQFQSAMKALLDLKKTNILANNTCYIGILPILLHTDTFISLTSCTVDTLVVQWYASQDDCKT